MKNTSKRMSLFIALIMCVMAALTACGTPPEDKTYDDAFLNDLKKGLMARWDAPEMGNETEAQYYDRLVTAELNAIGDYTNKKFEDSVLQEKAISYINLLHKQKDALTYFNTDYSKGVDLWQDAYSKRTQAVRQFINDYDLKFPDKYKDTLTEFENTAKVADENDKLKSDVQTMLANLQFDKVKEQGNYKYYEGIIENVTDKTFDSFTVDVNLVDSNGIIVDTEYTYAQNFAPGRKAMLEFMTDKEFATMEFTANYY